MRTCMLGGLLVGVLLGTAALAAAAQDKKDKVRPVYPAAVLPFQERGAEVKDYGGKVTQVLFANLAASPDLYLVEREDLQKTLEELKLNLSGLVKPDQAMQVGQLTGAKILVTGSVFQIDKSVYIVAKVIGTETSRVLGASVKGKVGGDLGSLADELAGEIAKTIAKRADQLVAKPLSREDRIAALKKRIGAGKLPVVQVSVTERHVAAARPPIDPAAETELTLMLTETGFKVIDAEGGSRAKADVLVKGEGFSEFAGRIGELISVKARLEVKAIDAATDAVVAIDRQTAVCVDLTEQLAGKSALQEAAAQIAERMLPKLAAKAKKGK